MNKIYKKLIAYNPTKNEVSYIRLLTYGEATSERASNAAFYDIYELIDRKNTIIIGMTIGGDYLQLSPAAYGTYIKENASSVKFLNKGRMLCAIEQYHRKKRMPYDLFD